MWPVLESAVAFQRGRDRSGRLIGDETSPCSQPHGPANHVVSGHGVLHRSRPASPYRSNDEIAGCVIHGESPWVKLL